VAEHGLVEIKCPNTATHIDTLLSGAVPQKYQTQMLWQMICTDRLWCDFVSYDPRMPEEMRLFVARYSLDNALALSVEADVAAFLAELDERTKALVDKYGRKP
jgi:hypothetical protein